MGWWRLRILYTFCVVACVAIAAQAQDSNRRTIVEDTPSLKDIKYVAADQTHSGFPVPRYVSLKYGRVNGRQGPSLRHPVLWQYQRKGIPLVVVAEMDTWRKVRDIHGDESWIHKPALSGERTVLALQETALYRRPDENARIEATIAPQVLLKLENCNTQGWCKFKAPTGYKGWAQRQFFWGAAPL